MQPYFFPYAQQFRHIHQCERWIVFDTAKYTRKSWINRNRIANRDKDWAYISVPVAQGSSLGAIREASIAQIGWQDKLFDQLQPYRGSAAFFDETMEIIRSCVVPESDTIADLNTRVLNVVCSSIGIETPIERLSELKLNMPDELGPGEWALAISEALGATAYSNAPGGKDLFDPNQYRARGIELEFYEPRPLVYATPGFDFTADLSIIDSLMWLGPTQVGRWCRDEEICDYRSD
ncbi:hypothetical protein AUC70_03295 [Methyloceanibacter stevinii]|uniref:WbqC-like protein n=2 Tax=Methyloceanibacter stevinii TaxID=1774970 RepID=A0A1E3VSG6_9HYPH|nr:hypothetical protein AUC70_03295 [Methyloceanibacter stevinii]